MRVEDLEINADLETILTELQAQLQINHRQYLQKMRDAGGDIMVQCPYHSGGAERKPSAGIRKSDGLLHCFACGAVHSLPEVISYCFGHEDDIVGAFGTSWLLKNFATVKVEERKDVALDFTRDERHSNINRGTCSAVSVLPEVSEAELDSYRYTHPYMYKRKLTDDIIELFDVGYDRDAQAITFRVKDAQGNVLFIARRSVVGKYFNYPAGAVKPLYGLWEFNTYASDAQELIVCESMIDALTCWVYGKYAVALNGLGNDLQFKQLRELPCRKLILATDNDKAGLQARKRIRKNVPNKLITEYVLPDGRKDINELSKEEFDNLEEVF